MSDLFDATAYRAPKKVTRRKDAPDAEESPFVPQALPEKHHELIGMVEDVFTCGDDECRGQIHDVIDEYKGRWLIQCCFCGLMQRVQGAPEALVMAEDRKACQQACFVMPDGRHEGHTLDSIGSCEKGLEYLRWAAKSHKDDAVRNACRSWLDSLAASR